MLVLARFRGERIRIETGALDDILIEILAIQNRQVTLKIDAPEPLGGTKRATYKASDTLQFGPQIQMTVLSVASTQTKLGINAPREFKIYREPACCPDA